MSTLAYAAVTARREASPSGRTTSTDPPGIGTYLDVLVALIPAEVIAAHAAILTFTTQTTGEGEAQTRVITQPGVLEASFWGLAALAAFLYLAGKLSTWDAWDFLRILIPPLAFVGWTMLLTPSAFDGLGLSWSTAMRGRLASGADR